MAERGDYKMTSCDESSAIEISMTNQSQRDKSKTRFKQKDQKVTPNKSPQ